MASCEESEAWKGSGWARGEEPAPERGVGGPESGCAPPLLDAGAASVRSMSVPLRLRCEAEGDRGALDAAREDVGEEGLGGKAGASLVYKTRPRSVPSIAHSEHTRHTTHLVRSSAHTSAHALLPLAALRATRESRIKLVAHASPHEGRLALVHLKLLNLLSQLAQISRLLLLLRLLSRLLLPPPSLPVLHRVCVRRVRVGAADDVAELGLDAGPFGAQAGGDARRPVLRAPRRKDGHFERHGRGNACDGAGDEGAVHHEEREARRKRKVGEAERMEEEKRERGAAQWHLSATTARV